MGKKIKLTQDQRYDVSLIGEAISEGGNGCSVSSYQEADNGILYVLVNSKYHAHYKILIQPVGGRK